VAGALSSIRPAWVVPGGRIEISGAHLPIPAEGWPHALVGVEDARVVAASARRLTLVVPPTSAGGTTAVRIDELPGETAYIEVARPLATGLHQVDSPAFDASGRLYVTHSGGRDTKVPVPLYRIGRDGVREPLAVELPNPTSMTLGPDGLIYVSSRFEGQIYRLTAQDRVDLYATGLGVATGIAFGPDGSLYVGDRTGSILRVDTSRRIEVFATLPASVAAFHLTFGPDDALYVTGPTLATHDALYRITPDRLVDVVWEGFGRPQGLAFDSTGTLYVADALAGSAGLYRIDVGAATPSAEIVATAPSLVGLAFDPDGGLVLAGSETVWRLDVPLRPLKRA
jgi:sugar lactone lactonase YvrE